MRALLVENAGGGVRWVNRRLRTLRRDAGHYEPVVLFSKSQHNEAKRGTLPVSMLVDDRPPERIEAPNLSNATPGSDADYALRSTPFALGYKSL